MLNPDGVIVGNYRTSLTGVDLNRVYKNPIEKVFPTVAAVKKLITDFNEERKVALYVDLHGHSRSFNVFMYGCHAPQCDHQQFLEERAVPWMLSQLSKDKFSFKKCKFAVQRCKEATGRISIWKEGVANSFTMEASFCGTNLTKPTPVHFTTDDLMSMGTELCEVLIKVHRYDKSNSYRFKVNSRIAEYYMNALEGEGGARGSTPPVTLPDVVTSTKTSGDAEEDSDKLTKRKSRRQMAKTLQRFQAISMKKLEVESSTSGSDSEDDNFSFHSNKSRSKHKSRKTKHKLLQRQQQPPNVQEHKLPKLEQSVAASVCMSASKSQLDHTPMPHKLNKEGASVRMGQHATVNSAPPRLQGHSQHGWRFVNRYTNRSNGGIPIFSQERSKERAEKKERLRSISQQIQNSEIVPLPTLDSSSTAVASTGFNPLLRGNEQSMNLPSLVWKPIDSHKHPPTITLSTNSRLMATKPESDCLESPSLRPLVHRRHSDTGITNSISHYKSVKKLVESQRKLGPAMNHRQTHTLPLPPSDTSKGRPPPPLPVGLPPKLCQYISEIWQKHSGNL